MKKLTGIVVFFVLALMMFSEHAAAETMTFQEGVSPSSTYTADAGTIQFCIRYMGCDSVQDTIFSGGSGGALQVGGEPNYHESRFLMEFSLSPIKEKVIRELGESTPVTIDRVQLVLTQNGYPNLSNVTIDVRQLGMNDGQSYDFDENILTWNNAPQSPGGTIGPLLHRLSFQVKSDQRVQRIWESSWAFVSVAQRALFREDRTLRLMVVAPASQDDTVVSFQPNGSVYHEDPKLIVDYHIGWPILKLNPLVLACLKAPLLCRREVVATGTFQDLNCAAEQFACGQLIQALDILQRRGAPPLEALFPKEQQETTPERRGSQKGDIQ